MPKQKKTISKKTADVQVLKVVDTEQHEEFCVQIPHELKIFGRTYKVQEMEHVHSSEGTLGIAAYRDGVIHIDKTVDDCLAMNVLWHEAFHIAQQDINGEIDEAQCRMVALFIHHMLVHNPAIVANYLAIMKDEVEIV
jgi:hypothetical protein